MPFARPSEVRRSFSRDSAITRFRIPGYAYKVPKEKRVQRTNFWPGTRLDYDYLERCKEVVCRVIHPTGYFKHKGKEIRLSVLPWSRGAYVDIRYYHKDGQQSPVGILLHQDIMAALLPDLIATVRRLGMEDQREPEQKAKVEVVLA